MSYGNEFPSIYERSWDPAGELDGEGGGTLRTCGAEDLLVRCPKRMNITFILFPTLFYDISKVFAYAGGIIEQQRRA